MNKKKKRPPKRGGKAPRTGASSAGTKWIPSAIAVSDSSLRDLVYARQGITAEEWSSGGGGGGGEKQCGPWTRVREVARQEYKVSSGERDVPPGWVKDGQPSMSQPEAQGGKGPPLMQLLIVVTQDWKKEIEKYETWESAAGVLYNRVCTYPDGSVQTESDYSRGEK